MCMLLRDKEKDKPKKIIIVPEGKLYAEGPKGKPVLKVKQVFIKNNTKVYKQKVKITPKIKEQPIQDFTKKPQIEKLYVKQEL